MISRWCILAINARGGSPYTWYTTGVPLERVSSRRFCLKGGVSNLKMAHPYTKIGEEPPPRASMMYHASFQLGVGPNVHCL